MILPGRGGQERKMKPVAVIFLISLALSGCGSSSSTSITNPEPGADGLSLDGGNQSVDLNAPEPDIRMTEDLRGPDTAFADTYQVDTLWPDTFWPDTSDPDLMAPDTSAPPDGCCLSSLDCLEGSTCYLLPEENLPGLCLPPLSGDECYLDRDCREDELCSGGTFCPCTVLCELPTTLGTCIPKNPEQCCFMDEMCPDGQVCRGTVPGGGQGWCVDPPADAWACHEPQDCLSPDFMCEGSPFTDLGCVCGEAGCQRPEGLGMCVGPVLDYCCLTDDHCAEGFTCAGQGFGGWPGTCLHQLQPGSCWDNDDCPEGSTCHGAALPGDCAAFDPNLDGYYQGTCQQDPCGQSPVNSDGTGRPCPNGSQDCQGQEASICSSEILTNPNIPPVCVKYCSPDQPCGPDAFCLPQGFSSACFPEVCHQHFPTYCANDQDCTLAVRWSQCCPCPIAVTHAQLQADPCLVEGTEIYTPPTNLPDQCETDCLGVLCEQCAIPATAACGTGTCTEMYWY